MLTPQDLVRLPYREDLTRAGLLYAQRSLPNTYDRMGGSSFERIRRIVAGKGVELAFRRYITGLDLSHDLLGATPFTDPDRYDVAIGGRQCDLKSFLIFSRNRIHQIKQNPSLLLQSEVLVPNDQLASEYSSEQDLYVFAFLSALVTPHLADVRKAQTAGQPVYLMHTMPAGWSYPNHWKPLAPLYLKAESQADVLVELGGQRADRSFQTEEINLTSEQQHPASKEFYSLAYLHCLELPTGRLGVHCPLMGKPYIVPPSDWGNVWVYGMEIILAGWITRAEFRRLSHPLPAGSRTFLYPSTRVPNHALLASSLHPMQSLINKARSWQEHE